MFSFPGIFLSIFLLGFLVVCAGIMLAAFFRKPDVGIAIIVFSGSILLRKLDNWVVPERVKLVHRTFFLGVFLQCASIVGLVLFGWWLG